MAAWIWLIAEVLAFLLCNLSLGTGELEGVPHYSLFIKGSRKSYDHMWFSSETQRLSMSIMGRSGAHMVLARTPASFTNDTYEIVIGAHAPPMQQFIIRRRPLDIDIETKELPNILDPDNFKDFWVTWSGGRIAIGTGLEHDQQEVLFWNDPNPFPVTAVSLAAGRDDIWWKVPSHHARELFYNGLSVDKLWYEEPAELFLTFGVKACQEARIGLTEVDGVFNDRPVIVLAPADNRDMVLIKENADKDAVAVQVSTPGVLDCNQMRYFWVNWAAGSVEVGNGVTVGDNIFINWRPKNPLKIVAIKTSFGESPGQDSQFHLQSIPDNSYLLKTQSMFDEDATHTVGVSGRTFFAFRLLGCYDAVLNLRSVPLSNSSSNIEQIRLVLATATSEGRYSILHFIAANGTIAKAVQLRTANIMFCDIYTKLWLTWDNSTIRLGKGNHPDGEIFIYKHTLNAFIAETLQLGSLTEEYQLEWQFNHIYAKTASLMTNPSLGYGQAWLVSSNKHQFSFKVKGKDSVKVILARYIGNIYRSTYSVRISNSLSSNTGIWRDDKEEDGSFIPTPGILGDGKQLQPFWISWTWKTITLGKGVSIVHTFNDDSEDGLFDVRAMSFGSPHSSTWLIGAQQEPQVAVYTRASQTVEYNTFWMAPSFTVLPFQLRAEKQCYVTLTKVPGVALVEIRIGMDDGTEIHVKSSSVSNRTETPGILSKTELRPFWISWFGKLVQFGKGKPLQNALVSMMLDSELDVGGIGILSLAAEGAEWQFNRDMATELRMSTHAEYGFTQMWVDVPSETSRVFRVKAASDASIALTHTPEVLDDNMYEITIGANNVETLIRKGRRQPDDDETNIKARVPSKDILNSNEMKTFWVSWDFGEVRLGRGAEVGKEIILAWFDETPVTVHSMSVTTDTGVNGSWELYRLTGQVYHWSSLHNQPLSHLFTIQNTHIDFSLWGCSSASVILLQDGIPGTGNFTGYVVNIDTNEAAIYKADTLLNKIEYPGLKSCGERADLWVGWKDNLFQLGRGQYPHNIVLQAQDESNPHKINGLSFDNGLFDVSPSESEVSSQWEVHQQAVSSLSFQTYTQGSFAQGLWMSAFQQDFLVFGVQSCDNVSVGLSQMVSIVSQDAYRVEVAVQTYQVIISIFKGSTLVQSGEMLNFKNCQVDAEEYWIGWGNGSVQVGRGITVGNPDGNVVRYVDSNPHQVNFIGFKSAAHAWWTLHHVQGNVYGHSTVAISDGDVADYDNLWMVPRGDLKAVTFTVKTCFDARIALSAQAENLEKVFEVVIGERIDEGLYTSSIRLGVNGESMVNRTMAGLLDCDHKKPFWISWDNHYIRLGQGSVGTFILLEWEVPLWKRHDVRAVGFGSGSTVSVNWHYGVEQAEGLYAKTAGLENADDPDPLRLWRSVTGVNEVVFSVKTCKKARVYLTSMLYTTPQETYLVELDSAAWQSRILDLGNNKVLTSKVLGNVVSCTSYKTFWIRWSEDQIQVRRGGVVGHGILLQAHIEKRYPINSIGFDGGPAEAHWNLLRIQGEVYRTTTPATMTYGKIEVTLDRRDYYQFSIRACSDAHMLLSQDSKMTHVVELIIGAYGNTKVELRKKDVKDPVAVSNTEDILSCDQLRRFWLSWTNEEIRFGQGELGTYRVLLWKYKHLEEFPVPFAVKYIQVATLGTVGEWELEQTSEMATCEKSFSKIAGKEDQKESSCTFVTQAVVDSPGQCQMEACKMDGNIVNYRSGSRLCGIRLCEDPDDPKLVDNTFSPAEVYALDVPKDSFIARTYRQALDDNSYPHWVSVTGKSSVSFKVKACTDVHIALAAVPSNIGTLATEVIIGGWGNTDSAIRTSVGHSLSEVKRVATPGILFCGDFQHLWLSWENNFIKAGQGSVVGQELFIAWQSPDELLPINSVGVSAPDVFGSDGIFIFGNTADIPEPPFAIEDEKYFINTDGSGNFTLNRWTISQSYLLFQLVACNDAQILLSPIPENYEKDTIKVAIGAEGNTKSTITKIGEHVESMPTPNILNCTTPKPFWLSWNATTIMVGRGYSAGYDVIVKMTDITMPTTFSEMAVATGEGEEGTWDVGKSSGHVFKFMTPSTGGYQQVWRTTRNTNFIIFKVQACSDAHILLSRYMYNVAYIYEIALGIDSNTQSEIRRETGGDAVVTEETVGVLNCHQLKAFWIKWYQGVEVGQGITVGKEPLLRLHEAGSHPIEAISITTGNGAQGIWHFSDINGDGFYISPAASTTYGHIWLQPTTHHFRFRLRSCDSACLFLSQSQDALLNVGFEVCLEGDPNNDKSRIIQHMGENNSTIRSRASTPRLLNCESFSELWLSWANDVISVGTGELSKNTFLFYQDLSGFKVRMISVRTPETQRTPAEWQFDEHSARSVLFTTVNGSGLIDWLTVDEEQFVYFQLTACSDAEILLSGTAGVNFGHKIVLGFEGNRSFVIPAGDIQEQGGTNGNPLDCTIGKWFWLSWSDSRIALGLGLESGSDQLIFHDLLGQVTGNVTQLFDIGAIGFRTTESMGKWEFSQLEGREFEVSTSKDKGYQHTWLLGTENTLQFKIQACGIAKIALTEVADSKNLTNSRMYELVLGATNNRQIELWKYNKDRSYVKLLKRAVLEEDLLHCERFQEFWLSWQLENGGKERNFRFGKGRDLYDLEMYQVKDDNGPYDVTGVGMASEQSSAKWTFKDSAAPVTKFYTTDYETVYLRAVGSDSFVFKVKTAEEAHITLSEHYHSDDIYQFILGASGNRFTQITSNNQVLANASTPAVLSETVFTTFWVSWSHGRLAIGFGAVVAWKEIVSLDVQNLPAIQYLALNTGSLLPSEWEYVSQPDNTLFFKPTNSTEKYASPSIGFGNGKTDFSFDVKACSSAEMLLRPAADTPESYRLVIGAEGNAKTQLYKGPGVVPVHEQGSSDVLSCNEHRAFRLSWKAGFLEVMKNSEQGQRILEWNDPDPEMIHAVSLTSGGVEETEWRVHRTQAPMVKYTDLTDNVEDVNTNKGFWMTVAELKSYTFKVKASEGIVVLLTEVPGVTIRGGYEIEIGGIGNNLTQINSNGRMLEVLDTPGILSADESRWFWVAWGHLDSYSRNIIQVGRGLVVGEQELLRTTTPMNSEITEVNALHFGPAGSAMVTWELYANTEGNFYLLKTDSPGYTDRAWLAPNEKRLHFEVQSCQGASVALMVDKTQGANEGFEVLFGADYNAGAAIYKGLERTELLAKKKGRGDLECNQVKRFWIKWSSTRISIGEGYTDEASFLEYENKQLSIQINVIGFSSDEPYPAQWRIPQDQDYSMVLSTGTYGTDGSYKKDWITVNGKDHAVFRIKACHTAKVLLVAMPDDMVRATEVVLELNDQTLIRKLNGTILASVNTSGILDCDHFNAFWISWKGNEIQVGKGPTASKHTILRHTDMSLHEIAALAVTTGDHGQQVVGHWQIFGLRGNTIKARTPAELLYEAFSIVADDPDDFFTTFRVRACADARFAIMPDQNKGDNAYEVLIGVSNNQRYVISKGGDLKTSSYAPDILSADHSREFWVKYHHGNVSVGRGSHLENREVLAHHDSSAVSMATASFSTWNSCPGYWEVDQRIGDSIIVHTPGDYVYDKVHIMIMDTYSFVFQVKAKNSVHIALSVLPATTGTETWEIGLQVDNPPKNFIRDRVKGSQYLTINNATDILDENAYNTFWVSWDHRRIAIGQDGIIGAQEVVAANIDSIPHFASISFCTTSGVDADWKFAFTNTTDTGSTSTSVQPSSSPSISPTTSESPATSSSTPSTSGSTTSTFESTSSWSSETPTRAGLSTPLSTSATSESSQPTSTESGVNPDIADGLSTSQLVGIVLGSVFGMLILFVISVLLLLRYRPDIVPSRVSVVVPISIHRAVTKENVTETIQLNTNPSAKLESTEEEFNYGSLEFDDDHLYSEDDLNNA